MPILASSKPVIGFANNKSELGKILEIGGIRINKENPVLLSNAILSLIDNKKLKKELDQKTYGNGKVTS